MVTQIERRQSASESESSDASSARHQGTRLGHNGCMQRPMISQLALRTNYRARYGPDIRPRRIEQRLVEGPPDMSDPSRLGMTAHSNIP